MILVFYCCIALIFSGGADAAKILGIAFFPAKSHSNTFQPVWRELSLRGHEITVITPVPMRDPTLTNLTEIDISHIFGLLQEFDISTGYSLENWIWDTIIYIKMFLNAMMEKLMSDPNVQKLIKGNAKFDLVILEPHHPVVYAFGHRFKAPVISK